MLSSKLIKLLLIFVTSSLGLAGSLNVPHKPCPSLSLVGGTEDLENHFSSVLAFSVDDNKLSARCTGTKIKPNKFLTAAHCFVSQNKGKAVVWGKQPSKSFKQIFYSFEPQITEPDHVQSLEVKSITFPPDLEKCFTKSNASLTRCIEEAPDLAVVEVQASLAFQSALVSDLDFFPVQVGDLVYVVGYGYQKEKDDSAPVRKHHLSQVVSQEELQKVYEEESNEDSQVDNELYFGVFGNLLGENYANLGAGDSGGPVFRHRNGKEYLVGVNSFTFCPQANPDCEVATNSFFARIHSGGKYQLGEWLFQQ